MNFVLRREIISHIFKTVGVFSDHKVMSTSMMEPINSNKFLLEKKLVFENENGQKIENGLWAGTTKIENSEIKIIIADITEDIPEFTLILQMDKFLPCAIRLSTDSEDFGSIYVNVDNNRWVEASTSIQAKMLLGFESLTEIYLQWQKLADFKDVYKSLIGFLNFYEQE